MISLEDYFKAYADHPDATAEVRAAASGLLARVKPLLERAKAEGVSLRLNPKTGTLVSGSKNGGFRPRNCAEGSWRSSHKEGRGVDVYDPSNKLDAWLTDAILEEFGLYREHPSITRTWCHLTDRAPGSGNRSFYP